MKSRARSITLYDNQETYIPERPCVNGHNTVRKTVTNVCLQCQRLYPDQKKLATPSWYEKDLIKVVHQRRKELQKQWNVKLAVDHIIPILSDTVCGLNCWHNLQIVSMKENTKKGYYYQQDW